MEHFACGNYTEAAEIFQQCINETIDDKEAYYFAAKAQEKIGNLSKARSFYTEIVQKFPNSSYASDAIVQIGRLDTAQYASGDAQHLPIALPADAIAVDYELTDRNLTLPVEINGKSWRMIFDTGANQSMIGKNHLRQLGIASPNRETNAYYVLNVMGKNPVWRLPVDLTIGGQLWRDFPFYVTENMPTLYPSLGQSFIKLHNYFVDAKERKIHFVKRDSDQAFEDQLRAFAYRQPFLLSSDDKMIVNAYVNGVPCEMQIDIGASMIVFSRDQLDKLGIAVSSTATAEMTNTMVGKAPVKRMAIDSIRLGPIQKFNLPTQVHERPDLPRPLLGLNFFRDISFFVDNDSSEILFFKTDGN